MSLLSISLRNLFRRRWRTFVAASVLAFAILFFLLVDTFMRGMMEISFNNSIDFDTAHLEVGSSAFFEDEELPLGHRFEKTVEIKEKIADLQGYDAMTPVLDFWAAIYANGEEFPLRVRAIEPESYSQVFKTMEYIVEGDALVEGDSGLIIGDQLASLLQLTIGDYYTLLFRDQRGSFNTIGGEIRGIIMTPHPELNFSRALLSLGTAREALGITDQEMSRIMVRMDHRGQSFAASEELRIYLERAGLTARSYEESSAFLVALEAYSKIEAYFVLFLLFLVGAIGIINVIILSALERTEEIGMMKAMGLKEGEIVWIFFLEAGGIGALGGVIGCGLGAIGVALLTTYGFRIDSIFGGSEISIGIPLLGRIYGVWSPYSFLVVFLFSIAIALLSSILPSLWAARKDPIQAIYQR